ncbi:hypothetical protein IE53DRAFT_257052 [Violaceomyces palustris]|uniref:Uncharacterized protein n=1 Tax=Violaceomyces palustris TaxID=1673888 RepID=A0ACD0NNA7_9BASI|nr:hypothetical protein IE53DRAFT_257052 [Violaceomyces palustris]
MEASPRRPDPSISSVRWGVREGGERGVRRNEGEVWMGPEGGYISGCLAIESVAKGGRKPSCGWRTSRGFRSVKGRQAKVQVGEGEEAEKGPKGIRITTKRNNHESVRKKPIPSPCRNSPWRARRSVKSSALKSGKGEGRREGHFRLCARSLLALSAKRGFKGVDLWAVFKRSSPPVRRVCEEDQGGREREGGRWSEVRRVDGQTCGLTSRVGVSIPFLIPLLAPKG